MPKILNIYKNFVGGWDFFYIFLKSLITQKKAQTFQFDLNFYVNKQNKPDETKDLRPKPD